MSRISKRQKLINASVTAGKQYSFQEALEILRSLPPVKFIESIDASINLGIDPTKSDQTVRGAVVLPHGTGREVKVAVLAQGELAQIARESGADLVGYDDLAEEIRAGNIAFDLLIATPDSMKIVGPLGQILGPRGLMPNPKVGTITQDVATAVRNAKGGQITYRADKGGIVHGLIGKINFTNEALRENLIALLNDIRRVKPATSKGVYIKKVILSSTMGPGLVLDQMKLENS